MNENLKLLLDRMMNDEALVAKLGASKSEDEAYAIASAAQDGFTKEEFVDAMNAVYRADNGADLSREDLARVSGGDDIIGATIAASALGAAAGAAAI